MDFQDPVPFAAKLVRIAHPFRIAGIDAVQILVAWDKRMRELAHEMAGDNAAENPSRVCGGPLRESVKLRAGYVRRCMIMSLDSIETAGSALTSGAPG